MHSASREIYWIRSHLNIPIKRAATKCFFFLKKDHLESGMCIDLSSSLSSVCLCQWWKTMELIYESENMLSERKMPICIQSIVSPIQCRDTWSHPSCSSPSKNFVAMLLGRKFRKFYWFLISNNRPHHLRKYFEKVCVSFFGRHLRRHTDYLRFAPQNDEKASMINFTLFSSPFW